MLGTPLQDDYGVGHGTPMRQVIEGPQKNSEESLLLACAQQLSSTVGC
jgi:hypothetical protein